MTLEELKLEAAQTPLLVVYDGNYHFHGLGGYPSVCRVTLYSGILPNATRRYLCLMTEIPENQGTSVTNAVEQIASKVLAGFKLRPEEVIWVEHYEQNEKRPFPETFDLVIFSEYSPTHQTFHCPYWTHLGLQEFQRLIGISGGLHEGD